MEDFGELQCAMAEVEGVTIPKHFGSKALHDDTE